MSLWAQLPPLEYNEHAKEKEDDIIGHILEKLNVTRGNFIDHGAWDLIEKMDRNNGT